MAVIWVKFFVTMFYDECIQLIEAMPEADAILIIWIKLILLAGRINANGLILLKENIPYSVEMLATIFRRPLSVVRLALKTLSEMRMIEITDSNVISITNWKKYQNIEGLDKIREQNKIRQANYRQKKQIPEHISTTSNVTSRDSNAIDIDIEKNKRIEKHRDDFFFSLFPENLKSDDFKNTWVEWINYRKENRKKITNSTAQKQLRNLSSWKADGYDVLKIIDESITNTWVGLFCPEQTNRKPGTTQNKPSFNPITKKSEVV